jgi:carbon-monoxide dehydrogenase large subunit
MSTATEPAIGRSVPRVEDRPLLTGMASFLDDHEPAGCLHAAFVRSPVAHADIDHLDLDAARALPGVVAVLAAADIDLDPLHPIIENDAAFSPPRPLLARDRVRFVGEPIAVVVAESRYVAEDAAELVGMELAERPPLVEPQAAVDSDEVLHDHSSNVIYDARMEAGDVATAFAEAATVIERTFVNPRVAAVPMEPRGALSEPDGDGIVLWSSTQAPHRLATIVAELLRLAPEAVRVRCPDIGGGFGQKAHVYPEDVLVAWLGLQLERPVKWMEDRSENLLAASHARDQTVRVSAAADADGRLLAIEADVLCDVGAYGVFPHGHILEPLGTPAMIPGPYRLVNYRARSRAVSTTKCPEGAYRGVGLPVSAFVHERLMDILASELDIDRAEIRMRNLLTTEELPYTTVTNQRYDSGDYPRALREAMERIGYATFREEQAAAREQGRALGLGLSCYVEYTGINSAVFQGRGMVGIAGYDEAHVELHPDGTATVWTTMPAIGQGNATAFTQIAADTIGLRVDQVTVALADTGVGSLSGTGSFASRSLVSGGGALREAGAELRQRLVEDAAAELEAAPSDLLIADGRVHVAGSPGRGVAVADLVAAAADGRYDATARWDPPRVAYPYATHACRVEVDTGTGEVAIDHYVIVEDCGRVINPLIVEGQSHGATAQGLGGTLFESMIYSPEGQLQTASLMDYLVPTAAEVPAMEVSHLAIPAPETPFGAKGVGEGGTLAPPGAIANAVADALGVECNLLPLTPERVLAAAREAGWTPS